MGYNREHFVPVLLHLREFSEPHLFPQDEPEHSCNEEGDGEGDSWIQGSVWVSWYYSTEGLLLLMLSECHDPFPHTLLIPSTVFQLKLVLSNSELIS